MLSENEKFNLITRNQDFKNDYKILKEHIEIGENLNVCWETASHRRHPIDYLLPRPKLPDFLRADCSVTVLIANIHTYLDNMNAPWQLLDKRTEYYEIFIKGMLKALKVPLDKLQFIQGTDIQLDKDYTTSVYRMMSITSISDAITAGKHVVTQTPDPSIASLLYPLLQALDKEFLHSHAQFGGKDQLEIFLNANKYLPEIKFQKQIHLMNPMIPGLTGGKMSASKEDCKIELFDDRDKIVEKLKYSHLTLEKNFALAFIKYVVFPKKNLFNIDILNKYDNMVKIELDFSNKFITEETLKKTVEKALCLLMENLSNEFVDAGKPNLDQEAYPYAIPKVDEIGPTDTKMISEFPDQLKLLISWIPSTCQISISDFPAIGEKPSILWSCRASGEPHIGYLIPLRKLAKLSNNNWKVIVLIEDIGALLYSHYSLNKPTWDLLIPRAELYKEMFRSAFKNFKGDLSNFQIVVGSEFQLSRDYTLLLYQSCSHIKISQSETIMRAMTNNNTEQISRLSTLIYPCIFALDQLFLKPTVRLLGNFSYVDALERFCRELNEKLHISNRMPVFIKHEMILSLDGKSLMKSPKIVPETGLKDVISISMCDDFDIILTKMSKVEFDLQNINKNPYLNIIEHIIWPSLHDQSFLVKRTSERGGDVRFTGVEQIKQQIRNNSLHQADVKMAVADCLNELLIEPIRNHLSEDFRCLLSSLFP